MMYNRMDRVVTLKISADLLEQLDAYAIRNGMNRSEAVRKAIEKLLKALAHALSRLTLHHQ